MPDKDQPLRASTSEAVTNNVRVEVESQYAAEHSHDTYAHVGNTDPGGGIVGDDGNAREAWFRVDDIHTAVEKVPRLGGEAPLPTKSGSGWSAACRDDQGRR